MTKPASPLVISGPLPLISIIMPAYNAGRYIGQAIASVIEQSYPNWELIIVDDASTDQTGQVVGQFTEDARIRYQPVPKVGHPSGVRNLGLKLAQGDFIAFLDADDRYFPQALERLLARLMRQPELIAVYGFSASIDEDNNPLPNMLNLVPDEQSETGYNLPLGYHHGWDRIVTSQINCLLSSLMIRRSAWEQIGFFNENLYAAEDYEFFVRMFLLNHAGVQCLSDYVYQYRIHAASLTKSPEHCERVLDNCMSIMHWLFNEAGIPTEAQALKSKAYLGCYKHLGRERLLNRQPLIARRLSVQAFQNPNIQLIDAVVSCGPLWLRSFLPHGLDERLVQARRFFTQIKLQFSLSNTFQSNEALL